MNKISEENRIAFGVLRMAFSMILIIVNFFILRYIFMTMFNYPYFDNIQVKNSPSISISVETATSESMFITDNKGLRFKKEDKSFAREEWIEKNGELFYFDTSSYGLNGDMKLNGQVYTFEKGKLKKIRRDTSYQVAVNKELYNSLESTQYLVYLDNTENVSGSFPIKYIRYDDKLEDFLGTESDKQYSSPNLLNIYGNEVYYLSISGNSEYKGILCRMRPNAMTKETIGSNVEGYIVLSDDVIYYYDGNIIRKAKNWFTIDVKYIDENDKFSDAMNSVPIDNNPIIEPKPVDDNSNSANNSNNYNMPYDYTTSNNSTNRFGIDIPKYNINDFNNFNNFNNNVNNDNRPKTQISDKPTPFETQIGPIPFNDSNISKNNGPIARDDLSVPLPIQRN